MSSAIDAEKTPAADAPRETEPKAKKPAKAAKRAKSAKRAKKAKPGKKPAPKPSAERTNKKAEVIAMMKRAKGATLAAGNQRSVQLQ